MAVDGLATYVKALQRAFRTRQPTGGRGRPRLVRWPDVVIGQVVKQYARRRVVGVVHRVVQGTAAAVAARIAATQGQGVLNTAYIERLNATFRSRLAASGRRSRGLARQMARLHAVIGTVYNFCTAHASLTTATKQRRTPAMAAGLTHHCWSVAELLHYQVPILRWQPPKRRGRRSK